MLVPGWTFGVQGLTLPLPGNWPTQANSYPSRASISPPCANDTDGNENLEYRSRKIGNKMYVINWLEESHPDFVTIIFNFNCNVMHSSGLLRFGSENQRIVFDGGIIEDLNLKVK